MGGFGRVLRGVCFYTGVLGLTAACVLVSPVAFVYLCYGKKKPLAVAARNLIWLYARYWAMLFTACTPVVVSGCDHDFPKPCIIVANHQSFFDSYCLGFCPGENVVFVVRAWPFSIPLYTPFMHMAGYINTDTMNGEELLARAGEVLASGASLVIYPEGTRSRTGELGRFHSGAFSLAVQYGVPVVPLCLDGMGAFLRRGEFLPRKAQVTITALDPVYPGDFAAHGKSAHMAMRREVKERMQRFLVPFA